MSGGKDFKKRLLSLRKLESRHGLRTARHLFDETRDSPQDVAPLNPPFKDITLRGVHFNTSRNSR